MVNDNNNVCVSFEPDEVRQFIRTILNNFTSTKENIESFFFPKKITLKNFIKKNVENVNDDMIYVLFNFMSLQKDFQKSVLRVLKPYKIKGDENWQTETIMRTKLESMKIKFGIHHLNSLKNEQSTNFYLKGYEHVQLTIVTCAKHMCLEFFKEKNYVALEYIFRNFKFSDFLYDSNMIKDVIGRKAYSEFQKLEELSNNTDDKDLQNETKSPSSP